MKKEILINSYKAGACHISSALSCIDILVDIFKQKKEDDIFLFGKASGVAAYYCLLAEQGEIPKGKVAYYLKNYPLVSKEVPGVVHSFGSIGHSLSVAAGIAFADRKRNVYVLISDGELMEGSTYEAALFIGQHNLKNLYVHVDDNKLVALGKTKDILNLDNAFEFYQKNIPNFIRHETIKGAGVDFMENDYTWHYKNLDENLLEKALEQIRQLR